MRIFSSLPAYSNPQTSQNKNVNNSQKFQSVPKLGVLSHDQVSFTGAPKVVEIADTVASYLPKFWARNEHILPIDLELLSESTNTLIKVSARPAPKKDVEYYGYNFTWLNIQVQRKNGRIKPWAEVRPSSFQFKNETDHDIRDRANRYADRNQVLAYAKTAVRNILYR